MIFKDRIEAGKELAKRIKELNLKNPLVIALPRGGVPVGVEIAKELNAPLDIFFVKKISSPLNEEAAIGSVSEVGLVFVNKSIIDYLNSRGIVVDEEYIQQKAQEKIKEINEKREKYQIEPVPIEDKDVIIVDDGIATGSSMYLASNSIVREYPNSITIAAPVAPADEDLLEMLRSVSHNLVILHTPPYFTSVGEWYKDFHQLSDEEVIKYLKEIRG